METRALAKATKGKKKGSDIQFNQGRIYLVVIIALSQDYGVIGCYVIEFLGNDFGLCLIKFESLVFLMANDNLVQFLYFVYIYNFVYYCVMVNDNFVYIMV